MDYTAFIEKATLQDERNCFSTVSEADVQFLPDPLKKFYLEANPVDVEIVLPNFTSIKLLPLHELVEVQEEYQAIEGFVFATLEGDPVLLKDQKVFIAAHGSDEWIYEPLAESFDLYIEYMMSL